MGWLRRGDCCRTRHDRHGLAGTDGGARRDAGARSTSSGRWKHLLREFDSSTEEDGGSRGAPADCLDGLRYAVMGVAGGVVDAGPTRSGLLTDARDHRPPRHSARHAYHGSAQSPPAIAARLPLTVGTDEAITRKW